jgi:hypothetical protein
MKKIFPLLLVLVCFSTSCKEEDKDVVITEPEIEDPDDRLAKRQMHFTFLQFQDLSSDSLVDGASIKLYKNFSDFDADSAVAVSGTSELGKLKLAGEDDGAAYYYRANHSEFGEVVGSAVNGLFDDYFTVEFE